MPEVARERRELRVEVDAAVVSGTEVRADTEQQGRPLTAFYERLLAEELTIKISDSRERLAGALAEARVDLNPHQLEAACFAMDSLSRGGCMLADEVRLGKTIEAGMVVAQLMAEGKTRILILAPAVLRAQWNSELREKFDLKSVMAGGRTLRATGNCFDPERVSDTFYGVGPPDDELVAAPPLDAADRTLVTANDDAVSLQDSHDPPVVMDGVGPSHPSCSRNQAMRPAGGLCPGVRQKAPTPCSSRKSFSNQGAVSESMAGTSRTAPEQRPRSPNPRHRSASW